MNILKQGVHPQFGAYFHALLDSAEADVSQVLAVAGNKVVIHRILASGEILSSELNLPFMRQVLQAVDGFVQQLPAAPEPAPGDQPQ